MKYPGIDDPRNVKKLNAYARMIHNSNLRFNLTGYKTIEEIEDNLITQSLEPFKTINVPRGTLMADLGTGSGIPGIPISILLENVNITMFDSTLKKIDFIGEVIKILELNNAVAIHGRLEELGKTGIYRERFDWVTSRAMADPFIATELGAPFLKIGGYMFIYASDRQSVLNNKTLHHIAELGMRELSGEEFFAVMNTACGGILLNKISSTDKKYPRRISAIRRDSGHCSLKD